MRAILFIICFVTFSFAGYSIASDYKAVHDHLSVSEDDLLLPGYAGKISGTDFNYNSAIPGLRDAMIVRATDGNWAMSWNTSVVPEGSDNQYISFIWAANINSTSGRIPMSLMFNGSHKIDFQLSDAPAWKEESGKGLSLYFRRFETDRSGDYYGFMVLRVPVAAVRPGKSQEIRIVAGKTNSNAWYMTMKKTLEQSFSLNSLPAIIKQEGRNWQPLEAGILYFGTDAQSKFTLDGKVHDIPLTFGYNRHILNYPVVTEKKKITAQIEVGSLKMDGTAVVNPVKNLEINFVQATHTDIGYTRPQTEILGEHLRIIDYALDYCDATDHYPEEAQFRWVCEVTWPVNEYLRSRPAEQVERLKQRIKEGRIEVAGMYVNYDEIPDEQSLAASMEPVRNINDHGIEIRTAVQNDVNGIAWAFNDYFNSVGIKYLNMGTHGHRALISFDRPTAFWWESPSGNRILAFRAEHYHTGNVRFHISRQDFGFFEKNLLEYINELKGKGYPFDVMMIQYSGYLTDNSPPSILPLEMIKKWNEKYEWPKLRSSLFTDFFEKIEKSYAEQLPVYRAAWPDWWTDGFGSGAREVAATRQAHTDLIAAQGALAMAKLMGSGLPENINNRIDDANDALLFYGEHTFGAAESVRAPFSSATLEMRRLKESYAWDASKKSRMIQEEALGLLQGYVSGEDKMSLLVFNTLPWERNGYMNVFLDHERVPLGSTVMIETIDGAIAPAQLERNIHGGSYWNIWVDNVPAFGYRKFVIDVGSASRSDEPSTFTGAIENEWYRILVDTEKGIVTSIYDKEIAAELVDNDAEWGFGQFIYEMTANRWEMERFYLENFERWGLDSVWFDSYTRGGIWNTIRFRGMTRAADPEDSFSFEVRLFNTEKRIDFSYSINKRSVIDPEAIYVAFPFKIDNFEIHSDVPGGTFKAGEEQIPGSSNDWNTVQNFAAIRNADHQVVLGSHQAPLMQFGNINTGRYEAEAKPENPHIYGWPMNNYWVTNFNANQYGEYRWTYYFTSSNETDNASATRFGWESRIPFLNRVMSAGVKGRDNAGERSVMSGFPSNVLLVNARPGDDENSILLQIRETGGTGANFVPVSTITSSFRIQETNVNGETNGSVTTREIGLRPYETKFLKLIWE